MIVISGVLVLVALVLLIIGVVGPDLTFVYASIGVSLVSLVFLVIGILQRRGETPAAETAAAPDVAPAPADTVTAVVPSQATRASMRRNVEQAPVADSAAEEPAVGGTVLVVEGRPRYHVDGCRYLTGKSAESVEVDEARDEGFTPCGVCKPDDALAAAPAAVEEQGEAEVVEEDVPGVEVPAPTRSATRAVKAPAKKASKPVKAAAAAPAKKAAASATTSTKAAAPATTATKAAAPARTATKAAAKAPGKAPSKAAAAKAPSKAAAAKAPSKAAAAAAASTPAAATAAKKAGSVVVIPDRGKFHRAECRYVRDVDDAEVLSKSAATRQGYAACGVCKP